MDGLFWGDYGRAVPPKPLITVHIIPTSNTLSVTCRIDFGGGLSGIMDGHPSEMALFLRLLDRGAGYAIKFVNLEHLDEKRRLTLEAYGAD